MMLRNDSEVRAETHQGLGAAFDSITRDVRLAGACLPTAPFFVPISGVNSGTTDSITVRTGVVSATSVCVQATLTAAVAAGSHTLSVDNVAGFKVDGWAYIVGTVPGEFLHVTDVSGTSGAGTVSTDTNLTQNYPATGGVYAFEERTYAIDTTNFGLPTLTLDIDRRAATAGTAATPVAAGIQALNIQYRLTSNCPPGGAACDVVNLPADDSTWVQVTQVAVSITARSLRTLSIGGLYTESASVSIQPRNIVTFRTG